MGVVSYWSAIIWFENTQTVTMRTTIPPSNKCRFRRSMFRSNLSQHFGLQSSHSCLEARNVNQYLNFMIVCSNSLRIEVFFKQSGNYCDERIKITHSMSNSLNFPWSTNPSAVRIQKSTAHCREKAIAKSNVSLAGCCIFLCRSY